MSVCRVNWKQMLKSFIKTYLFYFWRCSSPWWWVLFIPWAGLIWCSTLEHNDGLAGNHLILCIFTTWKPDSNWCHGLCSDSSCKYVLEMKTSTGRLTDDMYTDYHSSRLGPDWRETEGTSKLPVGSCMGEHARSRTCFKCMWNVDK